MQPQPSHNETKPNHYGLWMSKRGNFFAVGLPQFQQACAAGLNAAVALLVVARGTGRDNVTTTWSAQAIGSRSGVTWRRARTAKQLLIDLGVLVLVKGGARPVHKVARPEDPAQLIWLPNELIDGAGKEVPPVTRLRQAGDLDALQLLIELYHDQELLGDGGIPRSILSGKFSRERILGYGPFVVYGFTEATWTAYKKGALSRYWNRKDAKVHGLWEAIGRLQHLGLLEVVHYLAESEDPESELIHALNGSDAAAAANDAARTFAESLPEGIELAAERFDYVVPVPQHMSECAVVSVRRLKYRPKTARTAAWLGHSNEACKAAAAQYQRLVQGDFTAREQQTSR